MGQAKAFYDKIQSQKMSRAATEAMHSNWLRGKQRYDARKLEIAAAKVSNLRGLSPLSEVRRKIAELQKSRERFRKKPVNHNADHHHKSLSGDLDDPNVFEMATADILVERKPPFRLERLESTIEFKALQSLDEADHEDLIPNSTFTVEIVPSTLPAKSSSPSRSPSAESVEISHAHVSTLVGEHEDEPHEHDDSSVRRRDSALDAFTMLEVRNILDALIKGMVA